MHLLLFLILSTTLASAQRVLRAELYKPTLPTNTSTTYRKRQFNSIITPRPDRSLYWINITVGTPGQPQSLQLDTGSRSLWVPAAGSALCASTAVPCDLLGSFTSSASSTFSDTGTAVTVGFVDGGSVTGNYFYDTVHISNQAVDSQVAILGTSGSGLSEGILGIGFPASYPTLTHNLAAQGVIASNSYSLWLDSLDATSGTILFGGLNTARFIAPLTKIPVVPDSSGAYNAANVQLTRLATILSGVRTVRTSSTYSETVLLDTGTTLTVLQNSLASTLVSFFGASYYPSGATSGNAIIPCASASLPRSMNFHFADRTKGPTINVKISELVLQTLGSLDGVEMCQFGIYGAAASEGLPTILGDTFLRSAYVVYDLDNNQIGLAQSVLSPGAANVIEIGAGGIPVGNTVG